MTVSMRTRRGSPPCPFEPTPCTQHTAVRHMYRGGERRGRQGERERGGRGERGGGGTGEEGREGERKWREGKERRDGRKGEREGGREGGYLRVEGFLLLGLGAAPRTCHKLMT
eukprot:3487487-Rhodomonas_salina.1